MWNVIGKCDPCPVGSYQPPGIEDICFQCEVGSTTDGKGKTTATDCKSEYIMVTQTK